MGKGGQGHAIAQNGRRRIKDLPKSVLVRKQIQNTNRITTPSPEIAPHFVLQKWQKGAFDSHFFTVTIVIEHVES